MESVFNFIILLVFLSIVIWVWFVPTIIAHRRKKHNFRAIFLLNIFFGWSVVGWVILVVWAATHDKPTEDKK